MAPPAPFGHKGEGNSKKRDETRERPEKRHGRQPEDRAISAYYGEEKY
jgi:hypothetical protein